ncbi:MAG: DUF1549 domain-containing protein [Verrucomicrobiota bacterium]
MHVPSPSGDEPGEGGASFHGIKQTMKYFTGILSSFPLILCVNAAPTASEVEFFEKKIRPVLAESCYECHNSVDKAKGKLALDWRDALVKGEVVVPGYPEKSLLIQAIRHAPDVEAMPSKKPKMANLIIKNFEEWIRMGAPDPRDRKPTREELARQVDWDEVRKQRQEWWSYQPIHDPRPPVVKDPKWNQSAIDRFVRARLEAEGLPPQSMASPDVLLRRLHLILVGVPPRPEVVAAFTAKPSRESYERIVDGLLASQRFGERWGRYWLDWFRYAESHGSEGDPDVPYATVYRDYVIRAINADVPYDQLVREHVAGDLLAKPRVNAELGLNESAVGPGHFRMVPHGFGVTDAYDEQITFTDNQVDVLSKAILGSTLSCARCHNHKFDPLSQKDFYKFYGIMISSRPGVVNVDSPALQGKNRPELLALKGVIRRGFADYWASQVDSLVEVLDKNGKAMGGLRKVAGKHETHPLHAWFALQGVQPEALAREWSALRTRHENRLRDNAERITQATFYADLREQETFDRWFKNGTGLGREVNPAGSFALADEGQKALSGIYPRGVYTHLVTDKDNATLGSVFHLAKGTYTGIRAAGNNAMARFSTRSYPLMHGGLHPAIDLKPGMSWKALKKYKYWNNEKMYYQLSTGPDKTFRPGKGRGWFGLTEVYAGNQPLHEIGAPALMLPNAPATLADRSTLLAFYRDALRAAVKGWRAFRMSDAQAELLEAFRSQALLKDDLASLPPPLKTSVEQYRALEKDIRVPVRAAGVVEGEPWDQPLLVQGLYKKESDPVERGFLEVFGGRTYSKKNSGRLELAEDLLGPENTLSARVIVNRLWHHTFSRGLVPSTDNFGRLGQPPSHPKLLDYLASRFRDEDQWSMKRMIRRMVTSRTFMSASMAPDGASTSDPSNALLSYYSPHRLDAEAIFDTLYFFAGNNQQPAVYRRAKRNRLDPFLVAFNYPIPTTSVGVRDLTNVPAQSLIMMNGQETRYVAEQWARRIEADRSLVSHEQRITALFLQAYSRKPTSGEMTACISYLSGKEDDGSLQELVAEYARAVAKVDKMKAARESLLAPVKARLQVAVDARNEAARKAGAEKPVDLKPIARWDFEGDSRDSVGTMHGSIEGAAEIKDGALVLKGGACFTKPITKSLSEKTLEVLVQLDRADQRGGGAMTLQHLRGDVFDGIVYAEISGSEWLAGSDNHRRTLPFKGPPDRDCVDQPVRMVIVFHADGSSQAYRNGMPYGKKIRKAGAVAFSAGQAQVVFGLRHGIRPGRGRDLTGKIYEARLYDRVLGPDEIAAAASGLQLETVASQDVVDALSPTDRATLKRLEVHLTESETERGKLAHQLADQRAAQGAIPGGLARLTHALLNSKELIYVY